ncbi:MAG: hypothetical protein ACTSRU_15785 [Candidatus Hodarchaeales archaeon]
MKLCSLSLYYHWDNPYRYRAQLSITAGNMNGWLLNIVEISRIFRHSSFQHGQGAVISRLCQ